MIRTEKLWYQLTQAPDRACAGRAQEWLQPRTSTQSAKREQECLTCPVLELCEQYAASLERWQKVGTLAGQTYSRVLRCEGCHSLFEPARPHQSCCSPKCAGAQRGS